MIKFKILNENYIYLIISSISIVFFNLNFTIYNDDFWWLDYCSKILILLILQIIELFMTA